MSTIYRCSLAVGFLSLAVLQSPAAFGVAFDPDPTGDPKYGNFGIDADVNNPPANSYNGYRKGGVEAVPGLPMAADGGDNSTVNWTNLTHGQGVTCCGNPGLFFGQSPSTSSYSGNTLQVGRSIDTANPEYFDSNGYRRVPMRIGFVESEADYVAPQTLLNGGFDLWTANHGSDSVYLNMNVGATDGSQSLGDTPIETSFNFTETTAHDNVFVQVTSWLKGQSGEAPPDTVRDERDRNRWISDTATGNVRQSEGLLAPDKPTLADSSQPSETFDITGGGTYDTGIGYSDLADVNWWMELNDAGNADPVEARKVKFNIQVGNATLTQIFDPGGTDLGSSDDDMIPNPSFAPGQAFQDGFFDWQNAIPVFYWGVQGSAASSDGSITATMAFADRGDPNPPSPADLNRDGNVDGLDLGILLGAWDPAVASAFGIAGGGSVPEPTTAVSLGIAIGSLLLRRRRFR